MNRPLPLLALLLAGTVTVPTLRAEAAKPEAAPAETPAAPPPVLDPVNLDALRPLVGREVTLEGTVVAVGVSKSGDVFYVNFAARHRDAASLVLFDRSEGKAATKSALDALAGARVRAQGRLEDYKGALQVKVAKASDITKL